jgi:hypothetical protein
VTYIQVGAPHIAAPRSLIGREVNDLAGRAAKAVRRDNFPSAPAGTTTAASVWSKN